MSKRSPLFYVGDKYKLIDEIKTHFPAHIRNFVEPFVGGGSVFLNVPAEHYYLNDIDKDVIGIHKMLCSNSNKRQSLLKFFTSTAQSYGLSVTAVEDVIPDELKKQYKKTYIAEYNREAFYRMRDDFNASSKKNYKLLYLLLIYGFNRMIRFNSHGKYNLPVGNVDFNNNVVEALDNYFDKVSSSDITWSSLDFSRFIASLDLNEDDLVYLDPPYLITFSEYNKLWNEDTEKRLLEVLDSLNKAGIKFAISNVTHYKGRVNTIFLEWAEQYKTHPIHSNYISYHDNTIKQFNEVLVTNF